MAEIPLPENDTIRLEKVTTGGMVDEQQRNHLIRLATTVIEMAHTSNGNYTLMIARQKMVLTVELPKTVKTTPAKRGRKKKI